MKFMLIAGEASGDTLGAELIAALRESPGSSPAEFFGAGGPKMAAAGLRMEFDLAEHAVVGIWEVLKNYSKFKSFFDRLLATAFTLKPDAIILIDYPGFNLRFAKAVRRRLAKAGAGGWKPKIVFYVSPQIWAWHESRVFQIARDIDLMLAIFPFEKAWYAERVPDFKVEFVGHPLMDRYAAEPCDQPAVGAGSDAARPAPLLLLLPGSRVRELNKHLPPMLAAARALTGETPLRVRMVLPREALAELARSHSAGFPALEIRVGGLPESLREAAVAIASSGTVTMECAYFKTPTVVIYKTSRSTYFLGRRFIKVKYLAMPNLLAGEEVYPEFVQDAANAENIAKAARQLLRDPARARAVKIKLGAVIATLGGGGASRRASSAILKLWDAPK